MESKLTETVADRIWEATRRAKLKGPTEVARLAKLNSVTVAAYMRDLRKPSLEACMALGAALKCDPFWLFYGDKEGNPPEPIQPRIKPVQQRREDFPIAHNEDMRVKKIPLYSAALAGPDDAITITPTMIDLIDPPIANLADGYAVRVSGESMIPRYDPGDVVYCHPRMSIKKGDFVVAQIHGKEGDGDLQGYIKKFVSIDDATLVLEQLNPPKKMRFQRSRVKTVHKIVLAGI